MLKRHDRLTAVWQIEISRHVFETYFESDEALVRSKVWNKPRTFVALAQRARRETSWTADKLKHAVRAFLVARSLRPGLAEQLHPTDLWRLDAWRSRGARSWPRRWRRAS